MRRLIWPVLFLFLMLLQGSMSVYYTGWLSCDLLLLAVYAYALLRGEKAGAVVGPRVIIGNNSIIGERSVIANSILWNKITVKNHARIDRCIITDKSIISDTFQKNIITPRLKKFI